MITKKLLKKLDRFYGAARRRLVLYADSSGHIEVDDPRFGWLYVFAFEDVAQLEEYLDHQEQE